MKYKFPSFTKLIDDTLVFNGDGSFVFYVPEVYFDRKNAEIEGEYVNLIGVIDYSVFDKDGKSITGLKNFDLPTRFLTRPSTIDKIKNVRLTKTTAPNDYRVLTYYRNDPIFTTIRLTQDIINVEDFFKVFKSGKLPTTIPYDKLPFYFIEGGAMNNINFKLSLQIFGVVVSEYCRNPANLKEPFRYTDMKNMTAYKPLNIVDIPKYTTPYASLTSENWDNAVMGSILNQSNAKSPMEKMLMESQSEG